MGTKKITDLSVGVNIGDPEETQQVVTFTLDPVPIAEVSLYPLKSKCPNLIEDLCLYCEHYASFKHTAASEYMFYLFDNSNDFNDFYENCPDILLSIFKFAVEKGFVWVILYI